MKKALVVTIAILLLLPSLFVLPSSKALDYTLLSNDPSEQNLSDCADILSVYAANDASFFYVQINYRGSFQQFVRTGIGVYMDTGSKTDSGYYINGMKIDWCASVEIIGSTVNYVSLTKYYPTITYVSTTATCQVSSKVVELKIPLSDIQFPSLINLVVRSNSGEYDYAPDNSNLVSYGLNSNVRTISVDGNTGDWNGISPLIIDSSNDVPSFLSNVDILQVCAANDLNNLYFRIDFLGNWIGNQNDATVWDLLDLFLDINNDNQIDFMLSFQQGSASLWYYNQGSVPNQVTLGKSNQNTVEMSVSLSSIQNPSRVNLYTDTFGQRIDDVPNADYCTYYISPVQSDFQISIDPTSQILLQGSSSTATITVGAVNGYSNIVNLAANGQPTGVQISFSPNNQAASFSSTMTIQVASSAAVGIYPMTITGTGTDNKVHTTQYTLTVSPSQQSSTISCSINSNPITFSQGITVTGAISPVHQAQVTLNYNKPDGTVLTRTVASSSSGSYADTYYPDAAGDWTIQAAWSGDSDHLGAQSQIATLTVTKQDTTITTDVAPSSVYLGNNLIVSGELQPAISAPIVLTYTKPDGSSLTRSVTSSSSGAFTDTFTPNVIGNWYVGASWNGDSNHNGVNNLNFPTPFTVKQVTNPSSISIVPSQNSINLGAGITFSGAISPSHAATVTIIFTKPDLSSLTKTTASSSNGAYSYAFTPDSSGTWLAIASWAGDSDHNGATSSQISFSVIGPPTPPMNLNANPVHSGVTLTWQAPISSGSSSITQYTIYRGNAPSSETLLGTVNANTFSYTDLSFGTYLLHYYYVTAVNLDGKESQKSNEVKCASLESVTGIETVVTINDFQVYDNKPFSIQQNFFIPLTNYGDFYWVQNVVKVERVEVSTGKYEWQMYGGFEIWKYTNWQTNYLTEKPVWFFMTQSAKSPFTKAIILQSTIDNGRITLQSSAHAPWTWSTVLPLNSYILLQDSSPTGWGSPEISLVGAEYAGSVVTFTGNTNGYVDTYTKIDSNNWIYGANSVIRNPNKAHTSETSNWLFWQENGDFQCAAAWADQGLTFRPDFKQPITTPPTLSSFVATLHSPANLYITDQNGLSVGYNLKSNQSECNIPGAFYSGPNTEPQVISIPNSIEGNYSVQVIGTGNGAFSVDFQTTTSQGTALKTMTGTISSGAIYQYNVQYTNDTMTVNLDTQTANPSPTPIAYNSPSPSQSTTNIPKITPTLNPSIYPTPSPSIPEFPIIELLLFIVIGVPISLVILRSKRKARALNKLFRKRK